MQTQLEERRGLDRRIKDLEIRLSGALSSKSLSDEEHVRKVKVRHLCCNTYFLDVPVLQVVATATVLEQQSLPVASHLLCWLFLLDTESPFSGP